MYLHERLHIKGMYLHRAKGYVCRGGLKSVYICANGVYKVYIYVQIYIKGICVYLHKGLLINDVYMYRAKGYMYIKYIYVQIYLKGICVDVYFYLCGERSSCLSCAHKL